MTYYKKGATNVICDRCGFKKKSTECKMQWNNLFVCADSCWEARHPMDLFNPDLSESIPEITRPEPSNTFLEVVSVVPVVYTINDINADPNVVLSGAETGDSVGIQIGIEGSSFNPVTYSITTQSNPGAFQIHPTNGIITVATEGLLDYDISPTETVTVRATDDVTAVYVEETYTINVLDIL
jgi:hypothetical protein